MIRRRSDHDPLADRSVARWLVLSDRQGTVLEQQALPAGTDPRVVLVRIIGRMTAEGWVIEGDTKYGSFFCVRAGKRRFLDIRTVAPGSDLYGASRQR